MKKIIFSLILLVSCTLMSCTKDYEGDSYDFSDSTKPYVQFKSTSISATTSISVTVRVRTAISGAATVVSYQLSGPLTSTGTVTIDRNKTEGTVSIPVPAGTIPSGQTTATGTLTLTSAVNPNVSFELGWNGVGKTATVTYK